MLVNFGHFILGKAIEYYSLAVMSRGRVIGSPLFMGIKYELTCYLLLLFDILSLIFVIKYLMP